MDEILRYLRVICRLLENLETPEPGNRRYGRIYGPEQLIRLRVNIWVAPLYPTFGEDYFNPVQKVRGKSVRLKLARLLEDEIFEILVGYKVKVRIDNELDNK
ncbi:MAG: hypothetical protein D6784_08900 [Chloroflexi bacterium]|nr:MAG: hypothetical protein D6784_08900 [Chloroflexota bacterium]